MSSTVTGTNEEKSEIVQGLYYNGKINKKWYYETPDYLMCEFLECIMTNDLRRAERMLFEAEYDPYMWSVLYDKSFELRCYEMAVRVTNQWAVEFLLYYMGPLIYSFPEYDCHYHHLFLLSSEKVKIVWVVLPGEMMYKMALRKDATNEEVLAVIACQHCGLQYNDLELLQLTVKKPANGPLDHSMFLESEYEKVKWQFDNGSWKRDYDLEHGNPKVWTYNHMRWWYNEQLYHEEYDPDVLGGKLWDCLNDGDYIVLDFCIWRTLNLSEEDREIVVRKVRQRMLDHSKYLVVLDGSIDQRPKKRHRQQKDQSSPEPKEKKRDVAGTNYHYIEGLLSSNINVFYKYEGERRASEWWDDEKSGDGLQWTTPYLDGNKDENGAVDLGIIYQIVKNSLLDVVLAKSERVTALSTVADGEDRWWEPPLLGETVVAPPVDQPVVNYVKKPPPEQGPRFAACEHDVVSIHQAGMEKNEPPPTRIGSSTWGVPYKPPACERGVVSIPPPPPPRS